MRKPAKLFSFLAVFAAVIAFSLTGAKADSTELEVKYTNPDTGYVVAVGDYAETLTSSEISKLVEIMKEGTQYGNIGFYTANSNIYGTGNNDYLGENLCDELTDLSSNNSESATVFLIEFSSRKLYIYSTGKNYNRISKSKAETITDNIYQYASAGDYYDCAAEAFTEINTVLQGSGIAQPMKYISNALLAVVLALLINFIIVKITTLNSKPSQKELFENLAEGYIKFNNKSLRETRVEKIYDPPSSSGGGGGGGHGGGGGGGGSHGGGGGHSF